jgi:hypothetical protein
MVFDGSFLRDLVVQVPVVAILVILLIIDRRDHQATVKVLHEEIAALQTALIDHMNRLNE